MHFGTEGVSFLDPPDAFLDALGLPVVRVDRPDVDADELAGPVAVLLSPPRS